MPTTLSILTEIANNPSTKAKEAIIKREEKNDTLRAVFAAAYDPTISYYIKKIPSYTPTVNSKVSLLDAVEYLSTFSSRKLTGGAAIDALAKLLGNLTADDATVIARVIDGDLKCGASDSIASRIWKNLVPEFPYMRCSLMKAAKPHTWNWKQGVHSNLKGDGMFCNADFVDTDITLTSRAGKKFPTEPFAELISDIRSIFPTDYRIIGELLVERNGKVLERQIGNGILNSVAKNGSFGKEDRPIYMVWDIVPIQFAVAGGRFESAYDERFDALTGYLAKQRVGSSVTLVPTRIVYSMEEAYDHYFELVAQKFEGTIIKNPAGVWFDGTSRDQIKLKVECSIELKIVGFNAGNGKNQATFGSIIGQTSDGLFEVNVPGFTDEMRQWISDNRESLLDTIMSVTFNNLMPPTGNNTKWSAFLPRFEELRNDKTEADSLQKVMDQFEAIIKPKK